MCIYTCFVTSLQNIIIKHYCIEVPLNGITSVPNFMKFYQTIQKLLVGDRQKDWWFDVPTFSFGSPWWVRQYAPPERRSTWTWIHGASSQKTLNFIILPVILCGCETERKKTDSTVFEICIFRRMLVPKTDEVTGVRKNCITRRYIICNLHIGLIFWWTNQRELD
jgi:hypothetical protein